MLFLEFFCDRIWTLNIDYSLFFPHILFKKINKSVKYFIIGWAHTSVIWKRWSKRAWERREERTWPCSCMAKRLLCFCGQGEMACVLGFMVTELGISTGKALLWNTCWIHEPFAAVFKPSSYLSVIPFLFSTKGKTCAMNKGERDATY